MSTGTDQPVAVPSSPDAFLNLHHKGRGLRFPLCCTRPGSPRVLLAVRVREGALAAGHAWPLHLPRVSGDMQPSAVPVVLVGPVWVGGTGPWWAPAER